jgi:hypothetical protein
VRTFALSLIVVALPSLSAMAAKNDVWILGIDHIDNQGAFTTYAGAGYGSASYPGPQSSGFPQFVGNAYYFNGFDGVARIHWQLSGNAIVNGQATGNPVPSTTELYKIDFFGTNAPGRNDWQPIEGDFNGSAPGTGEGLNDAAIPWAGEFGTNHQYIAADQKTVGAFHSTGPGPHTPSSDSYNAASNGIYMWLTSGSSLYAKWNFSGGLGKSWSAIRLTQMSPLVTGPVTGDYNGNGEVDSPDYALWRKQDGSIGAGYAADGDHNGFVDIDDYILWQSRFARTSGSGSGGEVSVTAVPEPAALLLLAMAVACVAAVRYRCS